MTLPGIDQLSVAADAVLMVLLIVGSAISSGMLAVRRHRRAFTVKSAHHTFPESKPSFTGR